MPVQRSDSASLDSFTERIARRRTASSASLQPDDNNNNTEHNRVSSLEEDLRLSAELGQALVAENSDLKDRLQAADVARDQLLDRLAASYRDNATLEKKMERLTNNLDAAESSQRTLLSALEGDRKTISRLSSERVRLVQGDQKANTLARERDDLKQEVDVLEKRVRAAEAKAKRATDRLDDKEALRAVSSPSSPSQRTPQHLKRSSSTIILHQPSPQEQEATHQLVESLLEQNTSLRTQVSETQALLNEAQEETSKLREAQQQLHTGDLSLAEEFSSSSSMPTSPALTSAGFDAPPPFFRRSSGSTSDSEGLHAKSAQQGRRRKGGVAPIRSRPSSLSMPKVSRTGRTLSVDMGLLYNPTEQYALHPKEPSRTPLESIADASPATSRVQSKMSVQDEASGPPSPTAMKTRPSRSVTPTLEASVQTDTPFQSDLPELLHSPVPSTSSSTPYPLQSSTSHKPASSVTSDSVSERISNFNDPQQNTTPDTTLLSVQSGHSSAAAASQHDSRTAALGALLEASTKLLLRVKGANVAGLEARLKRQRLPGDVAHLAKSTVKDIMAEIDGLRETFRRVVEAERRSAAASTTTAESLVTRRDFVQLVKLLREMLNELGRLRSIINRIELDPSLANKVAQMDSLAAYEEPEPAVSPASSGLLAPISRLLWSNQPSEPTLKRKPSAHPASKLSALNSVAAETVNVEFGSGQVKQAIKADAPNSNSSKSAAAAATIRQASYRSDARSGLRNIFAGAAQSTYRSARDDGWVALSRPPSGAPHDRQRAGGPPPPTLSTAMDAVLDNFHGQGPHASHGTMPPHPNLLERTLRPRGLSDSSIHSTFQAHGHLPAPVQVTTSQPPPGLAFDDDDLEATLNNSNTQDSSDVGKAEEPEENMSGHRPLPTGSMRPPALGTSMGGGASLFGHWGASRPGLYNDVMDSAPSSLRH